MVARVAKSLNTALEGVTFADDIAETLARAAIEAMREPTEAMAHAGFKVNVFTNYHDGKPGCPNVDSVAFPRDAFDAELTKVTDPEKLAAWEKAPRCRVARVTLPAEPAWQAMIDAALKT